MIDTGAAVHPEAAYYQAVEEFFVSRRGDPLFLSSADWTLVHKWRRAGMPLRVVLRGIADALDSHAHSWGRNRRVGSLRYCAAEVDAARERWERALALGRGEGIDLPQALGAFAEALEAADGLGPTASPLAAVLSSELRQRAVTASGPRDVEPWLAEREAALVAAMRKDDGREVVARIEAEVETALAPYAPRMPTRVLGQVRAESVARRLLADHGLPRLSLFLG